jgi:hypothetical protein
VLAEGKDPMVEYVLFTLSFTIYKVISMETALFLERLYLLVLQAARP